MRCFVFFVLFMFRMILVLLVLSVLFMFIMLFMHVFYETGMGMDNRAIRGFGQKEQIQRM